MDAGALRVVGINPGQSRPNEAVDTGCWCPFGNVAGCAEKAMFVAEAGTLTLRGPVANGFNASCVAGQSPECVVGPFQSGVGLTYGADRIALLSEHLTCGNDEPDIAGGVVGKEARRNWWGNEYKRGRGVLDPEFDSTGLCLDIKEDRKKRSSESKIPRKALTFLVKILQIAQRRYPHVPGRNIKHPALTQDYPATAGFLTVLGAFPDQIVNCTRNQACTFDLQGNGLNSAIHRLALRDQSVSCGDGVTIDTATRRRRDVTANPCAVNPGDRRESGLKMAGEAYTAVGVTLDGYLTFSVDAIQALDSFVMCFCVPATGGGLCSTTSLNTYQQSIGILDIRGATPNQAFTCGRGGRCTLDVLGRGLSVLDRVKIVNMSTDCTGEPNEDGFFKSLLIADPAPASNSTSARFSLGQVTAGGTFKVCYCASFEACNSLETFNHQAGELVVVDPLSDLSIFSANVASITIQVHSALEGTNSRIRCATSEYEPSFMPSGADIANGQRPSPMRHRRLTRPPVSILLCPALDIALQEDLHTFFTLLRLQTTAGEPLSRPLSFPPLLSPLLMGAVHGVSLKYVAFGSIAALTARWITPVALEELIFEEEVELNGLDNLQLLFGLYLYNVSIINLVIAMLFNLKLGMGILGKDTATGAIPLWSYVVFSGFHCPTLVYTKIQHARDQKSGFPELSIQDKYLLVECWDGVPPTVEQLEEAAQFAVAQHERGDVLVHCAHGRLFPVGVGQGEATDDTQPGQNFVEIYFKTFVKPSQQYRVWCVEGSAQSFILPPTPSGHLIFTATERRLGSSVYPSFLWPQAAFYAELYDVFPGALSARRLATSQARVQTSASPYMCNQMLYADAVDMLVRDAGTGQNDARLVSSQPLEASAVRLYVCFFASALATGIALVGDDRLTVQKQVPTFSLQRLDGLILQRFYRGVLLKVRRGENGAKS
eukprot:g2111.t1